MSDGTPNYRRTTILSSVKRKHSLSLELVVTHGDPDSFRDGCYHLLSHFLEKQDLEKVTLFWDRNYTSFVTRQEVGGPTTGKRFLLQTKLETEKVEAITAEDNGANTMSSKVWPLVDLSDC